MFLPNLALMCVTMWCVSGICNGFGETSCGDVRRTFAANDIGALKMVPYAPKRTRNLRICPTNRVTCCTAEMERRYQQASQQDFMKVIKTKLSTTKFFFTTFIREFKDDMQDFSAQKRNETTMTLSKAFPTDIDGAKIISESLFDSLEIARYETNRPDMASEIEAALSRTFKGIFSLHVKNRFSTENNYKCIYDQYNERECFGRLPQLLAEQLFAAYNNTLTFYESTKSGLEALNLATKSVKNRKCNRAVVKMQYCSHCYGLTLIKPCSGLCKNVMRGCLVGMSEMDLYWKHYIGALTALANSVNYKKGDIESEISHLVRKITEASFNQTNLWPATKKYSDSAFCKGREKRSSDFPAKETKFSKRKRNRKRSRERKNRQAEQLHGEGLIRSSKVRRIRPPHEVLQLAAPGPSAEKTVTNKIQKGDIFKIDEVSRSHKTPGRRLRTKMLRFANQLSLSLNFFMTLPDELCDPNNQRSLPVSTSGNCWDGQNMVDRYNERVVTKGLEGQQKNPEMNVKGMHPGMQQAVENLRLSSKMLLLPNGYDSIPMVLREMPYFVKKNLRRNISITSAPCDDEDNCVDGGSAESSGEPQDVDQTGRSIALFPNQPKTEQRKQMYTTTLSIKATRITDFKVEKDTVKQIFNTSNVNTEKISTLLITVDVTTLEDGGVNSATKLSQKNTRLRTLYLAFVVCFIVLRA